MSIARLVASALPMLAASAWCTLPFDEAPASDPSSAPIAAPAAILPPLAPVEPPAYHRRVEGPWGSMWIPESFEQVPVTHAEADVRWESPSLRTSLQIFDRDIPGGATLETHLPSEIPPSLSAGGSPVAYSIDIGGVPGHRWDLSGFDSEQYTRRGYAVRWAYGTHLYVAICDATYGDAPVHCLQALATLRPPG